nr:putative capsid protein [Crucivirus sp.]
MPQVRAAPRRRLAPAPRVARRPAVTRSRVAPLPARSAPVARRVVPKQRSQAGNAFRSGGSTLGGMLGSALGGPAGGAVGGMLGRGAGAMFSKLFGHGDYAVTNADSLKENNIVLSNAAQAPMFGSGRVACKFVHREFLGDVFSSSTANTFKIDSYPINPGQGTTFPWLSGVVGAKFQQYRINGMTFEFRSMSSDALNSTNTALGSVIMSTDYDSADDTFASKQEMENTEYGISCKPSINMLHGIECARSQTPVSELYIRAFDVPTAKDIRLYDLGRFSIASVGCQGTNVNLGELWVSYDIDAFKAIEQVPGYLIPFSQYSLTGALATVPLGTAHPQLVAGGSPNSIDLTLTANKVSWPIDIEVGSIWRLSLQYVGSTSAALTTPVLTSGNGMFFNGTTIFKTPSSTTTQVAVEADLQYQGGATPNALPYFNIANFVWTTAVVQSAILMSTQVSGLYPGVYTSQVE